MRINIDSLDSVSDLKGEAVTYALRVLYLLGALTILSTPTYAGCFDCPNYDGIPRCFYGGYDGFAGCENISGGGCSLRGTCEGEWGPKPECGVWPEPPCEVLADKRDPGGCAAAPSYKLTDVRIANEQPKQAKRG